MAKKGFIQSAIKRPGRVKRAAARDGISVSAEAKKMSHSPNKSRAAAGRLALRFEGKAKHGNIHRTRKTRGHKRANRKKA